MTPRPVRAALFAAVLFSCQGPAAVLAGEATRDGSNPIGPRLTVGMPLARTAHPVSGGNRDLARDPAAAPRADSAL